VLHAVPQVGDYKLPLPGENVTWTGASEKVADQADKWLDEGLRRPVEYYDAVAEENAHQYARAEAEQDSLRKRHRVRSRSSHATAVQPSRLPL
jgi:hypothetical protein